MTHKGFLNWSIGIGVFGLILLGGAIYDFDHSSRLLALCNSSLGILAQGMYRVAQQNCAQAQNVHNEGMGLLVVSILLLIAAGFFGLIAYNKKQEANRNGNGNVAFTN